MGTGKRQTPTVINWTEWERQQRAALDRTLFNRRTRSGHSLVSNRPVPRPASAHYCRIDTDPRNVYFY